MQYIYFFQKRNPLTGELTEQVIDCDERGAWGPWNKPRDYLYLGRSQGKCILEANKKVDKPGFDARGVMQQPSKDTRKILLEAVKKEIEEAKKDKTPPKDLTRVGLTGRDQADPALQSYFRRLQ